MTLPITTKTIHSVDYSDFEKAVKYYYGVDDYSFPADAETGNDTSVATSYYKKYPLGSFEQEELNEFKATGEYNMIYSVLLQDMVNNDIIPEGEYLIEVSW